MKLGLQFRFAQFDASTVDADQRTVRLSFSSEAAVKREFGNEVLSHRAGACDLSRLNAGAPLLFNHNRDDVLGVVVAGSAEIGVDGRGYATVRFAKTARGDEIMGLVADGVLTNVSTGYNVATMDKTAGERGGPATFTATHWTPAEISIVTVPADPSVGIGRAAPEHEIEVAVRDLSADQTAPIVIKENSMTPEEIAAQEAAARTQARDAERARQTTLNVLATRHERVSGMGDLIRQLRESDKSIEECRAAVLEKLGAVQVPVGDGQRDALDLTDKEKQAYSLVRALRAQADGNWKEAGFERECSNALAQRRGQETVGFYMPTNIRFEDPTGEATRAASATAYAASAGYGSTQGNNLVATQLLSGSFIDMLRHKAMVTQMGATMLSGLVGNIAIPRQKGTSQVYWISPEGADVTESEGQFDLVSMSPKTVGAYNQITRQMIMQSTPDIELLVRNDVARVMALGVDSAALTGSGTSGQPLGVFNQAGIGSVVGGTNGGAISIDNMIDLETAVTSSDADIGALAYMTNAKVVGALKKLKSTTGAYLWSNSPNGQRGSTPGEINGYTVARTNQVPSNLTKGTGTGLSAVYFGNWSDVLIGEWGSLEILLNPYGAGFKSGTLEMRALQSVDIAIRHAQSFACMSDAITG
jgi:HK97 family phage major capsid protein/HK97 family phage prohead protease